MLTRILTNSGRCVFVDGPSPNLSRPQRRHMLTLAEALLVCEGERVLAALQRDFRLLASGGFLWYASLVANLRAGKPARSRQRGTAST